MRLVLRDQYIGEPERKKLLVRALSSLSFEANGERGIMPKLWTSIVCDHMRLDAMAVLLHMSLDTFQMAVRWKMLDACFPPRG